MLKSLFLENFTVFSSAQFEFSPGINVIIGENGTGKTHLLKAAYCLNRAWPDLMLHQLKPTPKWVDVYFEKRLAGLFQPDHLRNLIRWGGTKCHLEAKASGLPINYDVPGFPGVPSLLSYIPIEWKLDLFDNNEVSVEMPDLTGIRSDTLNASKARSIFIPSKEIVSFYEGLSGLLDEYKIKLDATFKDMATNIDFPELNNPPKLDIIDEIEDIIGGRLELDGRRLIFVGKDGNTMGTPLLAEGIRKLAILPYFIRHGLIQMKGETLFWDEPETNLNPRLISKLAEALVILAREGVQIILATHSLFLLKEIDLQLQLAAETQKVPSRFFALSLLGEHGVQVSAGDNLVDVDPITALDMEIDLADRYQEWSYKNFSAE